VTSEHDRPQAGRIDQTDHAGGDLEATRHGQEDVKAAELTPAQLRVFVLVSVGRLNKQIAFDLGIAEATVKAHMTAITRKLNVQSRTQAAMTPLAMRMASEPRASKTSKSTDRAG